MDRAIDANWISGRELSSVRIHYLRLRVYLVFYFIFPPFVTATFQIRPQSLLFHISCNLSQECRLKKGSRKSTQRRQLFYTQIFRSLIWFWTVPAPKLYPLPINYPTGVFFFISNFTLVRPGLFFRFRICFHFQQRGCFPPPMYNHVKLPCSIGDN